MQTPRTDWNKKRYLIVDGDEKFRSWSEGVLRKVGATEVRSVPTCKDGFVLQKEYRADVLLVDLQLRDMHPVDFMRRVRKLEEEGQAETLIIPVTASADAAILRQACLAGIQSFIRKPTDVDNFIKRVEGALINPRRFVFGRRYFGPERRLKQTAYEGAERRRPTAAPVAPPRPTAADATPVVAGKKKPTAAAQPAKPAAATQPAKPAAAAQPAKPAAAAQPAKPAAAAQPAKPAAPAQPTKPAAAAQPTKPTAPAAPAKKTAVPKTPAETPLAKKPAVVDEPESLIDDGGITLIADTDVAAIDEDLSPGVKQAIENHMTWLRTGGEEGERASLQGSDLHGAHLGRIDLSNVNLREADLSDADCAGINLQGADLRQANLSHANITEGNLGVAKLRHSSFKNTRLDGANLRGADLAGATFHGASLKEADFTGANLLSTDFLETDLSRSKGLDQRQFNSATADSTTVLPGGLRLPPKEE